MLRLLFLAALLLGGRMTPASGNHLATPPTAAVAASDAGVLFAPALLLRGRMTPASGNHIATPTTAAVAASDAGVLFAPAMLLRGRMTPASGNHLATPTTAAVAASDAGVLFAPALLLRGRMTPASGNHFATPTTAAVAASDGGAAAAAAADAAVPVVDTVATSSAQAQVVVARAPRAALLLGGRMTPASGNHLATPTTAATALDAGAATAADAVVATFDVKADSTATTDRAQVPDGAALLLGVPMMPTTAAVAAQDAIVAIFDVKANITATCARAQVPAGAAMLLGGPMMPKTAAAAPDVVVAIFDIVAQAVGVIIGLFLTINMKMVISRYFGRKLSIILAVVFVLVFIVTQTKSQEPEEPVIVPIEFEDDWGDEAYNIYFGEVHNALGSNTEEIKWNDKGFPGENHFILPEMGKKIRMWIHVRVKGESSGKYAFLLFRADSAYLLGFTNEYGTYCTKGSSDFFPNGCKELPFKDTYRGLFNKPRPEKHKSPRVCDGDDARDETGGTDDINPFLGTVRLGRLAARNAASVLADYQHDPDSTTELLEPVRKAMLVFVLMTSEAVRFKPISNKCKSSWITGGYLSEEEYQLVFFWKELSIIWCRGDEHSPWSRCGRRIEEVLKLNTLFEIDRTLDIVKMEKNCRNKRKEK